MIELILAFVLGFFGVYMLVLALNNIRLDKKPDTRFNNFNNDKQDYDTFK